jgi:hypothetical protein
MSVRPSGNDAILAKALEDMEQRWTSTAGNWRDRARDEFEKKHLDELRNAVVAARHAMNNVEELLRQVVRECS